MVVVVVVVVVVLMVGCLVRMRSACCVRELKKTVSTDAPIYAAVREGQRMGRLAKSPAHEDIEALLAMPLAEARKKLNIAEPVTYQRAHAIMRGEGIDPYDLLGQQKAAA